MATYSYSGTKITGMSTTGKVFKNTKIKDAKKGQTYFNKSTGHVYKCTEGGKASKAKWRYLRTDIAKKPTVSVSSLGAPERVTVGAATRCMKATWKTPAAMIDTKKGDRATALDIHWYLGIAGKDPDKVVKTTNEKATESTINLSNLKIGKKTYTRNEFYPFTGKPKLNYVTIKVVSRNGKGAGVSAKATRNFNFPRSPVISDFTFDSENGQLSCTITTDAGADYYERYDTRYTMTAYYSATDSTTTVYDSNSTNTSISLEFDDASYASRPYGEFVKVTVRAWARGYKGDSAVTESVFYIAYPAKATIEDISISGKSSSDKCTVYVDTHSTDEHPVDRVKLEYLANSIYEEANQIPADAGWDTTDIMDDAECEALAMSVADLMPDRGKYTWIRLKTYHANEAVLFRYSDYKRIKDLETPAATSADDKIVIASAVAGADGKSAVVNLGWDDGALPSTGTEISWDVEEDAWKSTKNPSDYEFTWEDKTAQGAAIPIIVGGVTYPHSAAITIKDLEESEKYFVKARRYLEGDNTTYSEYSNSATVVTSEKPESVGVIANRYVPKGSGLNVYWTFSGNGLQREWQIVDSNGTILANGEGSLGSTQIPADRLIAFAEDGDIEFTVQVSTGSGFVVSESKKVTIIESPTLEITGNSLVHAHEEEERDFSGDIVTFKPKEGEFVKSLKVPLNPVQDLHGYDKPWVGGAGANKWDEEWEVGGYSTADGSKSAQSTTIRSKNAITVTPNGSYYVGVFGTGAIYLFYYDQNGDYVGNSGGYVSSGEKTMPNDAYQLRFQLNPAYGTTYNNDIAINYPSTVTTYSPWKNLCPITGWTGCNVVVSPTEDAQDGTTYPVSWQTEAGTVYGGTVDLVSGVLTVTMVSKDLGTLNYTPNGSFQNTYNSSTLSPMAENGVGGVSSTNLLCEAYKVYTSSAVGTSDGGIAVGAGGDVVYIKDTTVSDATALKTALNGIKVVYKLATPQTYQLDPVQVALLIGEQNNIWNNVGITKLKLAEVIFDGDQLQTNDLSLSFKSNKVCDIKLIVTSQGAVGQFPQGILRQTAGDTIHSNLYVPVWTKLSGEFTTTVHLPLALDFWDKASYTLSAMAIDRQTGLKSAEVGFSFPVGWAHQAPSIEPLETYTLSTDTTVSDNKNYYVYDSETETYTVVEPVGTENPHNEGWYEVVITEYVTVTPRDYTDENGTHHLAAEINLTPPPNYDSDDIYDIYRVTGDGAQLIGQGFPLTYTVVDEYAPFGEDLTSYYRIAIRTSDGDISFADVEYVLGYDGIRLDWSGGYIEYPYSVSIGDSYQKDVDIRHHMDGSINGYWNQGVKRKGSLNTDAIKIL